VTSGTNDARDLARKAEIVELLLEAARRLGETLEPEGVYDTFHDLLRDVVPHDGVVVSSFDERDDLIRCEYAWVEGNRLDPTTFPPVPLNRKGGGMQSRVIMTGEPLLVTDVNEKVREPGGTYYDVDSKGEIRKLPDEQPTKTQAAMMVPVKEEGRVVGVVQLMTDQARYTPEQLEVFDGLVRQMAAAVRNVRLQKERRRLEAAEAAARAIAAERETAQQVVEAVGDGIFLLDDDGVVQLWNSAAELITNVRAWRVRGNPISSVFPAWDSLSEQIPVAEPGVAPRSATLPMDIRGLDLWLSFSAVQSPAGTVYAFRDLTSERRLEEEKSDFIATVSHELRTPMAAVYGAAQTLLQRGHELEPERSRELLEMIVTQASRLSHITEEVLLAGRLDRGEVRVQLEPVDVGEVTRAAVEAMREQLPSDAAIEVEIEPDVGPAAGDPDRIQQVLVNLIDNAVKYGGGQVQVRVAPTNGRVRLTVADSGPGIPLADQERIFEKFYRADPHLTTAPHGTGLGLYISRELVLRMAGKIDVSSEASGGATFSVELPQA
jgi:two-component system, OmpR family, phosphate regulon sensor histidine kinase PhoR